MTLKNFLSGCAMLALLCGVMPVAAHAQTTAPASSGAMSSTDSSKMTKAEKKKAKKDAAAAPMASKPAAAPMAAKPAAAPMASKPAAAPMASKPAAPMAAAPAAKPASSMAMQPKTAPHPGDVWVNSETKVYHGSSSKYAGNTKKGMWMSEADAQKAGYKKASN